MRHKRILVEPTLLAALACAVCASQAQKAETQKAETQTAETQTAPAQTVPSAARPLPDMTAMLREVEANQRKAEAVKKDYLYQGETKLERLNGAGAVKQTQTEGYEVFWVSGVRVVRTLSHDGKPISGDELRKENDRIDKEVDQARKRREKADANGTETDSQGHPMVTLSRMLELGRFSNPRRIQVAGRDTILVDFVGDPQARTHTATEGMIHDMAGLVAVDEQDRSVQHLEGHFLNNFHLGGGLLANIDKNFQFAVTNQRINDEVWLPAEVTASGKARFLLFVSIDGRFQAHMSGYRKFKATSTVLPTVTPVEGETGPEKQPQVP